MKRILFGAMVFTVVCAVLAFFPGQGAVAASRGLSVVVRTSSGGTRNINLYSGYHALVIGAGAYENGWPRLRNAVRDAREVAQTLKAAGWSVDLLEDPDSAALNNALNSLVAGPGKDGDKAVLIWFSGHGSTLREADGSALGYIVPVDAPLASRNEAGFMGKAVDMRQMETVARRIASRHVLMVFDSCFSGSIFNIHRAEPSDYIREKVAQPVRQFITAGGENEQVPDRSEFKTVFLQGMRQGYADRNSDGYVTGEELGAYVEEKVINYTRSAQHPQYGKINNPKLDKGDFVFQVADGTPPPPPPGPNAASLKVETEPSGAVVYVNGVRKGAAPVNITDVSPGRVTVRAEMSGYDAQERTLNLEAGQTIFLPLTLPPAARKARLTVTPEPSDANVRILNISPPYRPGIELDPGRYHVEVSRSGYAAFRQWVELASGDDLVMPVRLSPERPVPPPPPPPDKKSFTDPATGMEFVWVPAGCFQMGSPSGESGRDDDEGPVHEVCVDGFWMGKYEVTQGQWKKVMSNNPSYFKKGDDYPVEKVSWNDAQEFIRELNSNGNGKFRLPTEAEWEYACRSRGKNEKYSGGNDIDRVAWYNGNSGGSTHRVGTKDPNGLGIYDMSGNVWEWVEDVYDFNAYSKHSRNNPIYTGGGSNRVVRGGSWGNRPGFARCAYRLGNNPVFRDSSFGFRLLRTK